MERRELLKMLIAASFMGCATTEGEWTTNPDSRTSGVPAFRQTSESGFTRLRMGEVKPAGWIEEQIKRDLSGGFAGCLDKLCPEASSDIFVTHRNTRAAKDSRNAAGIMWWNGETEGNWRTGQIMMAYLVDDAEARKQVDGYVGHILASQDADGYLGIFAPDLRYTEQGELWTQACLLRGLLAYAELTKSDEVLRAVRRAADLTIHVYRSGEKPLPVGESHDLMFIDVAERLYDLTGDPNYPEFSLWFYENWSRNESKWDATLPSLLDIDKGFFYHGVNTYENVRVPLWLASATARPDLVRASRNALLKIARYRELSGSSVSQEMIENRPPDPSLTEYEYCATKELQATFQSAFQKTGRAELADLIETIWFNAAQGSRLPDGTAISYLTSDNRLRCDELTLDGQSQEKRNKYSPTHMDVAVCCNPNATQVAALFVSGMWLREGSGGLVAALYGPCTLQTSIAGTAVRIEERTHYPFETEVELSVYPDADLEFPIWLRNPAWSSGTSVSAPGATIEKRGRFWCVSRRWKRGDTIRIRFVPEIRRLEALNGEEAILYGPLLFAQQIPSRKKAIKKYSVGQFEDTIYEPEETDSCTSLALAAHGSQTDSLHVIHASGGNPDRPFDTAMLEIHGGSVSDSEGNVQQAVLVPLGNAPLLRRVTFPVAKNG